MAKRFVSAIVIGGLLIGTSHLSSAQELVAKLYDMSDTKFSIEAISPKDRIREYAICKAVWFAEKKNARSMSLSDPIYSEPAHTPEGWIVVNTTAYLDDEPNPSGNPKVSVADYAAECRRNWDWYN